MRLSDVLPKGFELGKVISNPFANAFVTEAVDESVNEASVSKLHKDHTKVVEMIQQHLQKYKSSKGTPQAQKHVSELKKLNAVKKKIEADLDTVISGLYKDAELKQD